MNHGPILQPTRLRARPRRPGRPVGTEWLLLVALALGCGDPSPADAGVDAGEAARDASSRTDGSLGDSGLDAGPVDGGALDASPVEGGVPDGGALDGGEMDGGDDDGGAADAGPADAGLMDAGLMDAGPPTPAQTAAAARVELDHVRTALADLTPAMQVDPAALDVEVAAAGVDGLIGEDGLMTLSVSAAAGRAFADLRTASVLIAAMDRQLVALGATADVNLVALRDALMELRARVDVHRDALSRLYRERVSLGIPGTPVVREPYVEMQAFVETGRESRLAMLAEGGPGATRPSVMVLCASGSDPVTITLINEETGAILASTTEPAPITLEFPAPVDDVTPVGVVIDYPRPMPEPSYGSCSMQLNSRRRFRSSPTPADSGPTFSDALTSYRTSRDGIAAELVGLRTSPPSGLDLATLDVVEDYVTVATDMISPLHAGEPSSLAPDTYDWMEREQIHVGPMLTALAASVALAGSAMDPLRAHISQMQMAIEGMVGSARSSG